MRYQCARWAMCQVDSRFCPHKNPHPHYKSCKSKPSCVRRCMNPGAGRFYHEKVGCLPAYDKPKFKVKLSRKVCMSCREKENGMKSTDTFSMFNAWWPIDDVRHNGQPGEGNCPLKVIHRFLDTVRTQVLKGATQQVTGLNLKIIDIKVGLRSNTNYIRCDRLPPAWCPNKHKHASLLCYI